MSRPGTMSRTEFVGRFGGVFEHSPWIAERAFDAGPPEECDSATALHEALCSAFRAATPAERLTVLNAHPDLAGRLALAGGLTEESSREQAAAGLDRLTADELDRFTELNDAYQRKFGFPFIMAVKGRSKGEILAAFEGRAEGDTATEFQTACEQVERIALLRLQDLVPPKTGDEAP